MTNVLERFRTRAEEAQAAYERAYRELFVDDAVQLPRFPAEAHAERVAALQAERARELNVVIEDLHRVADEARATIEELETGDVTRFLSGAALNEAAAKRDFVTDDVWSLSPAQLRNRLQAVLTAGDKTAVYCYWRAGAARGADLDDMDLDGILAQMRDHLAGPERLRKVAQARAILEESDKVELYVSNLKRGARSSAEAYLNRLTEAAS